MLSRRSLKEKRRMNNIILAGFMGCGKTTIAKSLAGRMRFSYLDTDEEIVKMTGESISQIFTKYGETYFRDLEYEMVKSLQDTQVQDTVIATGGGVLTFERNARVLQQIGKIVIIDRNLDDYIAYLSKDSTRPLVFEKSMAEIECLYNSRLDRYKEFADMIVRNDSSIEACVSEIMRLYQRTGTQT